MPSVYIAPIRFAVALLFSLGLSLGAYKKRALSFDGAIAAAMVGFVHCLVGFTPTVLLFTFFLSSSLWTKYKSGKKAAIDSEHQKGGQRDWMQVVANGGVGTIACLIYLSQYGPAERQIDFILAPNPSKILVAIIGAYAAANADTWASEIGSLSTGANVLITSFKRVPRGTNGGVSVLGSLASLAGGLLVGIVAAVSQHLLSDAPFSASYPAIFLGALAGVLGSLIDSVLGATVQYSALDANTRKIVGKKSKHAKHISGVDWLDNNEVNLLSIVLTALLSLYVAPHIYRIFGVYV